MFFSDGGVRVFGAVTAVLFGGFAVLFAIECIPTWIEMDEHGLRFRKKLRVAEVQWTEVEALGTSIPSEISPGELLLRLTPDACATRKGADPDSMFHVSVPALEDFPQAKLLEAARVRWEAAGGRGAAPAAAAPTADDDVYCTTLHVRGDDDRLCFVIVLGGEDPDALVSTIRRTVDHLTREHRYNPEFGGEIRISLVPDLTPNTEGLRARMDLLTEELGRTLAERGVVATFGRPIRLSWQHGHSS